MSRREPPPDVVAEGTWASVPRPRWLIELPGRILDRLDAERTCWIMLGVGMALSAALILWFTRGTTFFINEVTYYLGSRGFDPQALLSPHNGHLILVPRLLYAASFELFGGDYLPLRVLEAGGVVLAAALFLTLAKRRVAPALALAATLPLLFLGSSWVVTLTPLGITHVYSVIFGLGALLALQRSGRLADAAVCVLLALSIATFSTGLAFTAGVAVSILLRGDRWRRIWIVLVPLALLALWYLAVPWLPGPEYKSGSGFKASNFLVVPGFVADAAASMATAVAGLSYDFTNPTADGITDPAWGVVIASAAALALLVRMARGRIPASLWTSLAALLAFWASTALVFGRSGLGGTPDAGRYVYAAAVLALLVATDALRGLRVSRGWIGVALVACVLSLPGNIAKEIEASASLRSYSTNLRSQVAAMEVARGLVDPSFVAPQPWLQFVAAEGAGPLYAAIDRNGSFGYTLDELAAQAEPDRELADATLAAAERIALAPTSQAARGPGCRSIAPGPSGAVDATVAPPGVLIESPDAAAVTLARFADTPVASAGTLTPGGAALLRLPRDAAPGPWRVSIATTRPVEICDLGGAQ